MSAEMPPTELPWGLLEIDTDGTVLYYKPERYAPGGDSATGRNLFDDLVRASNVTDFRQAVNDFRRGRLPTRNVYFTFLFGDQKAEAKLLLARVHEQSEQGGVESVFVHISRG